MGRPSNYERARKGELHKLSTDYLIENFHTFDKATKIRIALEVYKKHVPLQANLKTEFDFKALADLGKRTINVQTPKWTLKEIEREK